MDRQPKVIVQQGQVWGICHLNTNCLLLFQNNFIHSSGYMQPLVVMEKEELASLASNFFIDCVARANEELG